MLRMILVNKPSGEKKGDTQMRDGWEGEQSELRRVKNI